MARTYRPHRSHWTPGLTIGCLLILIGSFAGRAKKEGKEAKGDLKPAHFSENYPLNLFSHPEFAIDRPYDFPGYDEIKGKATGFFHIEKINGKYWFIDPNGRGYWHAGILGMGFGKFGFGRGNSPNEKRVRELFGSALAYARHFRECMQRAGFTGMTVRGTDPLAGPLPFIRLLGIRGFARWRNDGNLEYKLTEGPGWHDVMNPFHPDFPAYCEREAELHCAPFRNSPWLIGYQLANELNWFGNQLASRVFCYPADHTAKLALIRFAKDYFKDIRAFNEAWKTDLNSFDDLRQLNTIAPVPPTDAADRFAWRWLEYAEETWFKHWAGAIRKYDPNHLILGIRQHGHESPGKFNRGFWKIMGKYCDAISLNAYAASVGVDPERGVPDRIMRHFSEISEISGRPLINSEWFPNIHEEKIFRWYQPFMIAHPAFVGSQLFNWVGHPSLSYTIRDPKDPELSTFQPKPELERAARDIFSRLVEIRLHESPEKYTFKAPAARLWNRSLPPRQEGPLPELRSGPVELRKISEGWQFLCHGKKFQEFSPYVHQVFNQQNRWVRSTTHTILAWYQDAEFTVIDSVLSHPGDEDRGVDAGGMKPPKPGEKKAFAYELLIRTWVARQEPGVVATQILGLNNRSQGSWFLKSISMACKTQLAGSGKDDQPYNALQIYRAAGWTDPVVDIGYVAFSPDEKTGAKYRIWKTGRRAASREFVVNTLMVGAQSWAPELTPTAIHMVWKPSLGHARLLERIEQVVQRYCKSSQAIPYQSRIVDR